MRPEILYIHQKISRMIVYDHDELVTHIRNKDEKAFSYLYTHYSKAILHVIRNIIPDEKESEDILQNVFIKIWHNFDSYNEKKGRLYTWMVSIARHQALDNLKSTHTLVANKRTQTLESACYTNHLFYQNLSHEFIGFQKIVNSLKNDHRMMIDLIYYEGYSQKEISKELNIPLGTVKTKIRKAILVLRDLTKQEVFHE